MLLFSVLLFIWGQHKKVKKWGKWQIHLANHDTSHSNYISIFPLFLLKPVKKWKVKYDWTAYFANNESFCTKPNNVGLAESIHSFDLWLYNMITKTNNIKIILHVAINNS